MVLDSENTLYGWGYNGGGGLGDGTTESHSTGAAKVQTKGTPMEGKRIVSFAVDSFLSTALADDGSVFAWGLIASPETGVDTPKGSYVPGKLKVKGTPLEGKRVAAIDQGFLHALLLDDKGTVYALGLNDGNQLGIGHNKASDRVEAVKVAGTPMEGKKIIAVSAGLMRSLALDDQGAVYGWGDGGELQDGFSAPGSHSGRGVPAKISVAGTPMEGKRIIAISAGNDHSVALADDGSVYTWGYSRSGQLGDGINHCGATIDSCISPPVTVSTKDTPMSGEFVTEVRAGDSYTSVTAKSGRVFVWGLESALTDEDENSDRFTPIEINTKGALGPYFETPKVSMGGRQATNVVRTGPRSLQFTAPPGQLGLVDVQIQLAVGERLLPGVFRYGSASPRAAVSMNTPGVPNGGSQRATPLGGLGLLVVLGGIAGGVVAWRRRARLG